jgi:MtrB/PioB family decaheme-associated outer membrane protein
LALADELPTLAQPGAPEGWYTEGEAAAGGQVFITKPGDKPANSAAKFNEYGDNTEPVFLQSLNFALVNKDGGFRADLHGANIGQDNQKLELDVEQPGTQYLTIGWYKTPQLRSNTAETIFGGVGTTNLTVPNGVVNSLYDAIYNSTAPTTATTGAGYSWNTAPNQVPVQNQIPGASTSYVPKGCFVPGQTGVAACAPGVTPVQTTINNAENKINLGLQRDRKEIDYRWTANEHWNIEVDYSMEHRYGVQEQGFLFSSSTSTPLAEVPMPVDDWTQDASISAEYAGLSPWGMNWNGMLRYGVSLYTDSFNSFSAENPFGGPGSPAGVGTLCPTTSATAAPNCYGWGQMGTAPDNGANTITGQIGVDLPGFKSNRYMATLQFTEMTQNQTFIPMTINSLGLTGLYPTSTTATLALTPMPRNSLDGRIDTTLFNNVLATQLTSDLKNKLSYRLYDYVNDTPALTIQNWIVNDAAISGATSGVGANSYSPHTTLLTSYLKQNAADEVTWNATKWATIGASTGWEQYRYSEYAVDVTNEYSEKIFGRITPTDWFSLRADNTYSWRRYDNYNWQAFIGNLGVSTATGNDENPWLRDVDLANRNRDIANLYADFTTPIGLTLTPTIGIRWDDYPTDPNILAQGGTQLGLRTGHDWSAGLEADWMINSNVSLDLSYTFEQIRQTMIGSSSATNTASTGYYSSAMGENVNTWTAGANFQLIPDRLALKLSGTYELATDAWNTGAYLCPASVSSPANCGIASAGNPAYPAENTTFSHLDATMTYKVDPTYLVQFGKGEVYLQLHYLWEHNSVTNWQNDSTSAYLYSTLNSSTVAFKDMIFLAGDNPNYNAQAISASLVVKW